MSQLCYQSTFARTFPKFVRYTPNRSFISLYHTLTYHIKSTVHKITSEKNIAAHVRFYNLSTNLWKDRHTVQITFIFIDFRVCDFAFAFKTQNAPCVSRFKRVLFSDRFQFAFYKRKRDVRLTCNRIWCILHRTLLTQMAMPLTSHIIAQMDLTSGFGN